MKRLFLLTSALICLICFSAWGRIINIPADYGTIQAGINHSADADTVLVQPGIYVENINFNGHNIVLASAYLISHDSSNITSTIIDGDSSGSVITLNHNEDNSAMICGFTIRRGYYNWGWGGGISCINSSPKIFNNIICQNLASQGGGGIGCLGSNAKIANNQIYENNAGDSLTGSGGGIGCLLSATYIFNNWIHHNGAGMTGPYYYDGWGGGISCDDGSDVIDGNLIEYNQGSMWAGGIDLDRGDYMVSNNTIKYNSCPRGRGGPGGGLSSTTTALVTNNCIIYNQADRFAGGVYCTQETRLINNCIVGNSADSVAGGIYCEGSPQIINTIIRSNTAPSHAQIDSWGGWPVINYCNVEGGWQGTGNIDMDPLFRDQANNDYHLKSISCGDNQDSPCIDTGSPFVIDTLQDCTHGLGTILSDIGAYGGVIEIPHSSGTIIIPTDYPTIQDGINASGEGDTIIVMPGTYFENIHFPTWNIALGSFYLLTKDEQYILTTILDGRRDSSVIMVQPGLDSTSCICGFTIQNGRNGWGGGICCTESNPIIKNNIIKNNMAYHEYGGVGGGIYCYSSRALIEDNIIAYNSTNAYGAGIFIESSLGGEIINNMIFRNNSDGIAGGGICLNHSNTRVIDNTIAFNSISGMGGGVYIMYNNAPTIINTLIWQNTGHISPNISLDSTSSVTISYCDIQGGWQGTGNIDIDPLFRDPIHNNYGLMSTACSDSADSRCVDAGDPDILDSLLDCLSGLGAPRSDIGAYSGSYSIFLDINNDIDNTPMKFGLSQNYPNPFNSSTSIQYFLPRSSNVSISIYDLLGRKVESLANSFQQAGHHQIIWNATGKSSGIYFYRIKAGDYLETKKMTLMN